MLSIDFIKDINETFSTESPKVILAEALKIQPNIALSFSGAEDVVIIDMAHKIRPDIPVFTLDTGRLHPETYQFIEKVRQHYGISIDILHPDAQELGEFVNRKGLFSFYQDGHEECCSIRKTNPLRRKLQNLDAWVTGQRRDQSPTRKSVSAFELDGSFAGAHGDLLKVNPLASWTLNQVWEYIHMFDVPFNPLHDRGYVSIGCEPCTKPVRPGQHEREGRWWWEEATLKECGLHKGNIY